MRQGPRPDEQPIPSSVERFLQPGEQLLWEGGPDPRMVFARQDAFLVPFSLLWTGFAAVWEAAAILAATALGAALGAPLVLLGIYLVAGRFFYKWHDRRQTRYAVTDRRALVVRLGGRQVLHAPVSGPMAVLRRHDGRHGSALWAVLGLPARRRVLTFSGGNATMLRGAGWPMPGGVVVSQVAFFDVDRFDDLLAVVTRAREAAGVTEPPRTLAAYGGQPTRGQPYGTWPYGGQPFGGPPPVPAPEPPGTAPVGSVAPRRPGPPAGWYPDPDPTSSPGGARWWDGVGWTDHVRPPSEPDEGTGGSSQPS
jgi:hypothetical protein